MSIVYINCKRYPFIDWILTRSKLYETRNRNTLGRFLGQRILLAKTGHGKPVIRASAVIAEVIEVFTEDAWLPYIMDSCISNGSEYDWQPDTKKKVLYRLTDVHQVEPFPVPDTAVRHGRTWCEYTGMVKERSV